MISAPSQPILKCLDQQQATYILMSNMHRIVFTFLLLLSLTSLSQAQETVSEDILPEVSPAHKAYIVPIEGQISSPQLFILRRGLKEAMRNDVKTVIMEIDTPGGDLGTMLKMMEALDKFEGTAIAFINDEAISAGSFISMACDEIYFAPKGIMGAAAAVMAGGQEIPETMTLKIESYLSAKTRSMTQKHPYRAKVQRAMMDKDYELKIDDKVLKEKGELLTLTAEEAMMEFGKPPTPLLANGIVKDTNELLSVHFNSKNFETITYKLSLSEEAAKWLKTISPVLMGLGLLCLFIEFKTPGFGVFGISGIAALLLVFGSNYLAGLAGHEEILVFGIGIALIAVEIFLTPGAVIPGALGLVLIIGSLLWAMADIWPSDGFSISPEVFAAPIADLAIGLAIAIAGAFLVVRYLPRTSVWDKLVLSATVPNADGSTQGKAKNNLPPKGATGIVTTTLRPTGQVEIDGKRYEAKTGPKTINKGTQIKVTGYDQFSLVVREIEK